MSTILLKCTNCNNEFEKDLGEYNRRLWKLPGNTNFFCSRSCSAKYTNTHAPFGNKNPNFSKNLYTENRRIRRKYPKLVMYYVQRCVRDSRFENMQLNDRLAFADHLVDLWNLQQYKCAFTGVVLTLRDKTGKCDESNPFKIASLDRIDSNIPYKKGNVQWVSLAMNLAKQDTNNDEFITYLTEITWFGK